MCHYAELVTYYQILIFVPLNTGGNVMEQEWLITPRDQAPVKEITIHNMDIGLPVIISLYDFVNTTLDRLSKVTVNPAKFRLPQIINMWQSLQINLEQNLTPNLILNRIPVTVTVSTGTYVRQIVRDVAETTSLPLLCDRICRTELYF